VSVIDLILEQKVIVFSMVFAGIVLAAAIFLFLYFRIRRILAQRPKRQERQARTNQSRADIMDIGSPEDVPFPVTEADIEQPAAVSAVPGSRPQISPATSGAPNAPAPANQPAGKPAPSILQQKPEETQPAEERSDSAPSSAMQDLLSSVFGDGEAQARYDVLLAGTDPVDIEDLVSLADQIAQKLSAKYVPDAAQGARS
jgi:hypothetical protein